jgi:predicted MFS family arabinose efflux permease
VPDPTGGHDARVSPIRSSRYYTLGILTLVYMLNFVDRQLLSLLQEPIREEMGFSDEQLGLLTGTAFAIFYVTAGIPIARWADIGNRRNIISLAVGIWSLMTALQGLVTSYAQLFAARMGVGVGEAGASPPGYSMLSDLFAPEERARAFSVYATGVTSGVLLSYFFGSWLSDTFGWRLVFLAIGLPGVAVALLVRFTVQEPARGAFDQNSAQAPPPVREVLHFLWTRKSFRHLAIASGLHAFVSSGIGAFIISFYVRSFQIDTDNLSAIAIPLGLIIGIGGAIGNIAGGTLADFLGRRDQRWYLWVCGISTLIAIPFAFATFLADDLSVSITLYLFPVLFGFMYGGPALAMATGIVGARMRALTVSIFFFILNLIGLGIGPWALGRISDALRPSLGEESLRYAIMIMFVAYLWSAFHYFWGARYIRNDLDRAPS